MMYRERRIAVVVPALNEEKFIQGMLAALPSFLDDIIVIDDGSTDRTAELVHDRRKADARVRLITHTQNEGLGQSLIDGYLASAASFADATVVMAGDNQMDPRDLPQMLDALIDQNVDYVKGNRLLHRDIGAMPRYRFVGNAILTILTKFATGYYRIMDPQCGYTVISNKALRAIPIKSMTRGYGYNADILCMLNIFGFAVSDVEVYPVYTGQQSKIKVGKYSIQISWLLLRLFARRIWQRYVVRDFHPLVLFLLGAMINLVFLVIPLIVRVVFLFRKYHEAPQTSLIILSSTALVTVQLVLFALWMDMDYNTARRAP